MGGSGWGVSLTRALLSALRIRLVCDSNGATAVSVGVDGVIVAVDYTPLNGGLRSISHRIGLGF
jgi:hypothetical protein